MKILSSLAAASLCALAAAQSPLQVFPVAPVAYYGWTAASPDHQTFFDLSVTNTVTLQAIATPLLSPIGQVGTIEVWITNPGITTFVGSEVNAANWTKVATGQIVGGGSTGGLAAWTRTACMQAVGGGGLVLNAGLQCGVAIRYLNVTPALVAVGALQTFTNADMTVSGGAMQYRAFVSTPSTAPAPYTAWCWRGQIDYAPGVVPHACAEATPYGDGCYTISGSFYQEWTDPNPAPVASAALNNKSLTMLPSGTGYVLVPGTAAFIPPTGAAVALPANDDGETAITPLQPFLYPGGVATSLYVHTNGYISVGSNTTLPGGLNWVPSIPVALNATNTVWFGDWHDYNASEAGSGLIVWEEIGSLIVITWNGVESYPTTALNPSTWQMQFDTASGQVNYVWQTIDAAGGSTFLEGDDHLIGFSPGGVSPPSSPINIGTLVSLNMPQPERFPLSLTTSAKPLIGTTISLDTANETPGLSVGLNFVTVGNFPAPGFDLAILGMPGCAALVDINTGVGNVISNIPGFSMSVQFPLPNNPTFAGITIYSQSVWLDPTVNTFGALSSNGMNLLLGNY